MKPVFIPNRIIYSIDIFIQNSREPKNVSQNFETLSNTYVYIIKSNNVQYFVVHESRKKIAKKR